MCFVEVKSPVPSIGLPLLYFVTLVAKPVITCAPRPGHWKKLYHALFTEGNFPLAVEANMLGDAESQDPIHKCMLIA